MTTSRDPGVPGQGGHHDDSNDYDDHDVVELTGGRFARPSRRGETVVRTPGPARRNVQALLRHFEQRGVAETPRVITELDADGHEVLSFLPGAPGLPPYPLSLRRDQTLVDVARAIRRLHDATVDFEAPEPWPPPRLEVAASIRADCVGHGDLAPWNMIFDDHGALTGVIDWDTAGPTSRAWDLSYAAYQLVPLHPTGTLAAWGWDTEPDRRQRLRLFADSYGCGIEPAELVDLVIIRLAAIAAHMEQQIRLGDPAFDLHRDEGHAAGYRGGAAFVIEQRAAWVG